LQQTSRLHFAQVDDRDVIGFVKEAEAGDDAVAVAIMLSSFGTREFWFHFGDIEIGQGERRQVREIENLVTGARHTIEWGGVRLRITPDDDPALLFRCLA
jgi:starch synthase (maltosyl-transferring)